MSFHRENVIWQSADGKWSRGFYDFVVTGEDPEWDVMYLSTFNWVSVGHKTEEDANNAWDGANPGSMWVIAFDPSDPKSVPRAEEYDKLAKDFLDAQKAYKAESQKYYASRPIRSR